MKDLGLKRNGQPRKIVARPQEANPAWLAAVASSRIGQPGDQRRQCNRCKRPAVKGSIGCYWHGGARALGKARLEEIRERKKRRYAFWSLDANQRNPALTAQTKTETIKSKTGVHSTGYDM